MNHFLATILKALALYFGWIIFFLSLAGAVLTLSFFVMGVEALLFGKFIVGLVLILIIAPVSLVLTIVFGKISNVIVKLAWEV